MVKLSAAGAEILQVVPVLKLRYVSSVISACPSIRCDGSPTYVAFSAIVTLQVVRVLEHVR